MTVEQEVIIVRPWYRQFYLRRGDADWSSDRVSEDGHERGLEAIEGFVYIGTTMYGSPTQVVIEVHRAEPGVRASADRQAETSLAGAGDLDVLNWEPTEPAIATIALPSGDVRLRASWFGTAAASTHRDADSGGDDRSPERIHLDIWPAR